MSRNGSGTYSLPAGNPVVTGTTISSSWANTTMNDIANAITGSIAADGQTPITANLNLNNNKLINVADPANNQDAATKAYVDAAGTAYLTKSSNLSDVANATTARTNLSAAKSGANSDITSITGLTTALAVNQGGTGAASITANAVVLGNGTSAVQTVAPSTSGNVLTSNGTTWVSQALSTPQLQTELFTSSGSWTAPTGVTRVEVLVIAGGGGYNGYAGTYGGGGGFAHAICTVSPGTAYTVTVGTGGGYQGGNAYAGTGGSSSFGSFLSATGGGGGMPFDSATTNSGSLGSGTVSSGTAIRTGNVNYGVATWRLVYATDGTVFAATCPMVGYIFTGVYNSASAATFTVGSTSAAGAGGTTWPNAGNGGLVFLRWVGA